MMFRPILTCNRFSKNSRERWMVATHNIGKVREHFEIGKLVTSASGSMIVTSWNAARSFIIIRWSTLAQILVVKSTRERNARNRLCVQMQMALLAVTVVASGKRKHVAILDWLKELIVKFLPNTLPGMLAHQIWLVRTKNVLKQRFQWWVYKILRQMQHKYCRRPAKILQPNKFCQTKACPTG